MHIDRIDRQHTLNRQLRTLVIPNVTKICGIATSCWDLFRLIFQAMLYPMKSCHGHVKHYEENWCCLPPPPLRPCAEGNMHWLWMQLKSNLPSRNNDSSALDRSTSTIKLALTSVTVWSTTPYRWGWSPMFFRLRKLITDDWSRANTLEQG